MGESAFNIPTSDVKVLEYIFKHYAQQIYFVMQVQPKSVLEIGPGSNVVRDFLTRKGILVKTFDNDPMLRPDIIGDVRTININQKFDLVLASEVLEHVDFKYFDDIVRRFSAISSRYVILSLPYPTIHLFGEKKLIDPNVGFNTRVPLFFLNNKQYPDDRFDIHHWHVDKGNTTRPVIRKILDKYFEIVSEKIIYESNCIWYVLKKRS